MEGGPARELAILAVDVPPPSRGLQELMIIRHDFALQPNELGKRGQDRRGDRGKTRDGGEKHRRNLSLFDNQFERHFNLPLEFTVRVYPKAENRRSVW